MNKKNHYFKKATSFMVVAVLCLGVTLNFISSTTLQAADSFNIVTIAKGYDNGNFGPNDSLTRVQLAQLIYNAVGKNAISEYAIPNNTTLKTMADYRAGYWGNKAMAWSLENEYFIGYQDGTFSPDNKLTFAEMSKVIDTLASKRAGYNATLKTVDFPQFNGSWAKPCVEALYANGDLPGVDPNTVNPNDTVTRAHAVAAVCEALGVMPNVDQRENASDYLDVPTESWCTKYVNAATGNYTPSGISENITASDSYDMNSNSIPVNTTDNSTSTNNKDYPISLSIDQSDFNLHVGGSKQLSVAFKPRDAYYDSVDWTTTNSSIVSVSSSGYIVGESRGTATITAVSSSNDKLRDTVTVYVDLNYYNSIEISGLPNSANAGETVRLTAKVNYDDYYYDRYNNRYNNDYYYDDVLWSSSNENVATINSGGDVYFKRSGEVYFTAKAQHDSNVTGTTKTIPVYGSINIDVTSISISGSSTINLMQNDTKTLTATVYPYDASTRRVNWSSSNYSKVSVDSNGVIKAVGGIGDEATITATAGDGSGESTSITVKVIAALPLVPTP